MKRLMSLLLVLAFVLPGAAALADLEDWEYHVTDDYTIRYPDYIEIYGVPEEEIGWNMEVFADPESTELRGVPVQINILYAGADDWTEWLETGAFPDEMGNMEEMERVTVDEPPVDLNTGLDTTYALFRSADGKRMTEAFIFDPDEGDLDYVVLCRYMADDEGWDSNVLHWMLETLTFAGAAPAQPGEKGSFLLYDGYWEYDGFHEVVADLDADETAQERYFIFVKSDVTDFSVEKLTWNDETFGITKAETLWKAKELTTKDVISIYDWAPEFFPNVRISAVNADGIEEVWYVSVSGENGDLILLSQEEVDYDPE